MVNKALNDLLNQVTLDNAMFMDEMLQELFPADCEDKMQFIKDHDIHIRNFPVTDTRELWMDGKKVGTFSQRFQDNEFIYEFTKCG